MTDEPRPSHRALISSLRLLADQIENPELSEEVIETVKEGLFPSKLDRETASYVFYGWLCSEYMDRLKNLGEAETMTLGRIESSSRP